MKKPIPLFILPLLVAACAATAQPPDPLWPEPRPHDAAPPQAMVRTRPNFQAPSATHCARPPATREVPGRSPEDPGPVLRELRGSAGSAHERAAKPAPDGPVLSASPAPAAAPAPSRTAPGVPAAAAPVHAESFAPQPQARQHTPVTAGVVDDNADFAAYLAFRERTRVAHRARDVRERHLLEVKDAHGRGVPDAEVAVQAANGHAMWARTDTAGRVWVHPRAFDPLRAAGYDITVRKQGRSASARLTRGQKSAVEVRLDARAAESRARLDLVFLIDATGSMADEIHKLKLTLHDIAREVAQLPSRPDLCFALVAYRDRGDDFLLRSHDFTDDLDAFHQVLGQLSAGGGGDYPEAMNEALHETVHNLSWRGSGATRMVLLLADAPPHLDAGGPQYDDDMAAALGKGIKVFAVGASGLDRQGEYIQRQIVQYTGGKFVFLTYANARNPAAGPGRETVHDVQNYSVETLDRLVVRLVKEELAPLAR